MCGVMLALRHPEVADRDCGVCQKYVFDHAVGMVVMGRDGKPMPRPKNTFAPCRYGRDGCAKGTPEASHELSEKNKRAYAHYLECKAVGAFPDDPIVRRNAGLIRKAEDLYAHDQQRLIAIALAAR